MPQRTKTGAAEAVSHDLAERLIRDFDLKVEGSRLEPLVQRLHAELVKADLRFKPKVYISEEWGCPDGVPLIGIPFYLFDDALLKVEEDLGRVEGESDSEIMRYLRHEAGHAFNYAYRFYELDSFHEVFGPYSRPYRDDYKPDPFSTDFVRYLPGWYAQKHPDEDFAETFAVWLDPRSRWRKRYAGWGCYQKLLFINDLAREYGPKDPLVEPAVCDPSSELSVSLGEHYRQMLRESQPPPAFFDGDLQDIFEPGSSESEQSAAEFLAKHRKAIAATAAYWTGVDETEIRGLIDHFIDRCSTLGLKAQLEEEDRLLMQIVAVVCTLAMNKLYRGNFIIRQTKSSV